MNENRCPDWMGLLGLLAMGLAAFGVTVLVAALYAVRVDPRYAEDWLRGGVWVFLGTVTRFFFLAIALVAIAVLLGGPDVLRRKYKREKRD